MATIEHVLTIAALSDLRRCGSAARVTRTIPSTFTSRTWRHSSIEFASTVPCAPMPALLMTTSSPPIAAAASSTARATDSSSVTSALYASAPAGAPDGSTSSTATAAPRAIAAEAIAYPMPDAPPVTTIRTPSKSFAVMSGNLRRPPDSMTTVASVAWRLSMSEHENQDNAITAARASYDRMAWAEACERYVAADHEEPLGPDDLERAAQAAHLSGRDHDADAFSQRAVHGYEEAGDPERAALGAWWLGMSLMQRGDMAQAGGWFARAGRLVEGLDSAVHGYLAVPMALGELFGGDATSARPKFEFALETGERFGDNDLRTLARLGLGRSSILLGDDAVGLALLDDAMVTVTAGEASPVVVGIVYCAVIEACQLIFDLRRAREWTAALSRWCDAQPELVPFRGACLIHRAEIMTFNGAWANAMDEVVRACDYLAETHNLAVADALYQRAELCRLRGQFDEAEAFYMEASDRWPRAPTRAGAAPPRARTDHDRGGRAPASARRGPSAVGASPPACALHRGAARNRRRDRSRCSRARSSPRSRGASPVRTSTRWRRAPQARWRSRTAPRRRRSTFSARRGAPGVISRCPTRRRGARVLIGLACRELGDEETAEMDLRAARHTFADLGAASDVARVDVLLAASAPTATEGASASPLTGREAEVLQLVAAGKTNRQIAEALVISEKTVARHISNIFVKISVSSRSAATGYAYQHGLT